MVITETERSIRLWLGKMIKWLVNNPEPGVNYIENHYITKFEKGFLFLGYLSYMYASGMILMIIYMHIIYMGIAVNIFSWSGGNIPQLFYPSNSSIQQKSCKTFNQLKLFQIQHTYRITLVKQHIQTTEKSIERKLKYGP